MRAPLPILALLLSWLGTAVAADAPSVMPSSCLRREALDAAEYQRLWRFLELGGGYRQWADKDCYPKRLDDAALAAAPRAVGVVVSLAGRDAFVVDLNPTWFRNCTKTATPVAGPLDVDGAMILALAQHLATLPALAAADIREIGFGEAVTRDKHVVFALYLGTGQRSLYLECFDDLDAAVERAADELGRATAHGPS
jgi:hypothetical protein